MEPIDNIIIISSTIEKDTCFYGLGLESGITLIPPKYEDVKFPIGDIFMFRQNGKWGLMSLNGDVLLTPEYDNIFRGMINTLLLVRENLTIINAEL